MLVSEGPPLPPEGEGRDVWNSSHSWFWGGCSGGTGSDPYSSRSAPRLCPSPGARNLRSSPPLDATADNRILKVAMRSQTGRAQIGLARQFPKYLGNFGHTKRLRDHGSGALAEKLPVVVTAEIPQASIMQQASRGLFLACQSGRWCRFVPTPPSDGREPLYPLRSPVSPSRG